MKIFIRANWGSDYKEISITNLQNKMNHSYLTFFIVDKITENDIYLTQQEEEYK